MKHSAYKIAVSGAAEGECLAGAKDLAVAVGEEIAKRAAILLTGATTGMPYFAALGAKKVGGMVIGFSPASTERQHEVTYKLPLDHHDAIFFSSFGYSGRNALLTTLSDAVITVCGRMGTLNEFTISFEEHKIVGVLLGSGGIADEIPHIIEVAKRGPGSVIYSSDPKELVDQVIAAIEKHHELVHKG